MGIAIKSLLNAAVGGTLDQNLSLSQYTIHPHPGIEFSKQWWSAMQ